MATRDEVSVMLEALMARYPQHQPSRGAPLHYARFLEDIPALLLAGAAREHMDKRGWFPSIAELRLEAAKLAGTLIFDPRQSRELTERQLFGIQLKLRGEFSRGVGLDEEAWELLIAAYTQIGFVGTAEALQWRLADYKKR